MTSKRLMQLLKLSFSRWNQHKAPKLGAALAYYTVLSLAPLMVLTVAIAGFFFGAAAVRGDLEYQLRALMGPESASAIQTVVKTTYRPGEGIGSTVLGIVALLFGASGAFTELRDSLNLIWDAPQRAGSGILNEVRSRFFSFAMVLVIGFLLLVSLSISAALAAVGKFFGELLPMPAFILEIFNFSFSFVSITFLFALIFKYVPDVRLEGRMDRGRHDVPPVFIGQIVDWILSGESCRRLRLRRGFITGCGARLGLLFRPNFLVRR